MAGSQLVLGAEEPLKPAEDKVLTWRSPASVPQTELFPFQTQKPSLPIPVFPLG